MFGTECQSVSQWSQVLRFQEVEVVFLSSRAQRGRDTQIGDAGEKKVHNAAVWRTVLQDCLELSSCLI